MEPEEFEDAEELLEIQKRIKKLKTERKQVYAILINHAGEGISDSCRNIIETLDFQLSRLKSRFNKLGGKELLFKFWKEHDEVCLEGK